MRFPLWTKLGLLFGGLFGSAIAVVGWWNHTAEQQRSQEQLQGEMIAVASALSAGIDGDVFASFERESDRKRPSFQAVVKQLHAVVEDASSVTWAGTCTRDDHGHWVYVVEHTNVNAYAVGFPIFDGEPSRNQAYEGEIVYEDALEDEAGRWRTVFAPITTSGGTVVGLVELVADADRDALTASARARRVGAQVSLAILFSLFVSFIFGRILAGSLDQLVRAARQVARGNLDVVVQVHTADEIGALSDAFNAMIEGLREREFIRDTFGRFVNPTVVADILEDRSRLQLGGERRRVTVIMSDLRGFTALSEELGAERMVALLNRYLSHMTEVVVAHDGNVSELLGDGMVILFGAPVTHGDDPKRALACAVAMLESLERFNAQEGTQLQMGIGVDTGDVIAGNIGGEQHMKYGVVGEAINIAARLESFTLGNQILASAATLEGIGPQVRLGPPLVFRAKGKKRPIDCRPVLGVDDHTVPEEDHGQGAVAVDHSAALWRIEGKTVGEARYTARLTHIDPLDVQLTTEAPLVMRDALKLELHLPGGHHTDVYGTVCALRPGAATVRLTGVPKITREALNRLMEQGSSASS